MKLTLSLLLGSSLSLLAVAASPAAMLDSSSPAPGSAFPAASPAAPSGFGAGLGIGMPASPAALTLPDPVAQVEGKPITRDQLETTFKNLLASKGKTPDDFPPEQRLQGYRAVLEQMILQRLVKARAAGVKVTDEEVDTGFAKLKTRFSSEEEMNTEMQKSGQTVDGIKNGIRSAIQQRKWVESQIGDKGTVTEAEAQAYYDKNPAKFRMPEQVRASHILIGLSKDASPAEVAIKQKLAEDTLARVKKGEDFAKVASEVSDDPGSKMNGGDLSFFSRGMMVPEFSDAAFAMKKGDIGGPVRTQFGFHIIKVTDRKPPGTVTFPEVKEKLIAFLEDQKKQNAVQTLLGQLRQSADVKVLLPGTTAEAAAPLTPLTGASSAH